MITKEDAETKTQFESVSQVGSDRKPIRCRAMGKCQIWKTRPEDFKLPVKHGMYTSFYLTPANAAQWIAVS